LPLPLLVLAACSNGGFESAYKDNLQQATIATAATHASGYPMGIFGKYLNGYTAYCR